MRAAAGGDTVGWGKVWAAGALAALAVGSAACGQSAGGPGHVATMAAVYASTVGAGSARVTYTLSEHGRTKASTSFVTSGTYSWASRQGALTTTTTFAGFGGTASTETTVEDEIDIGNVAYSKLVSVSPASPYLRESLLAGWAETTSTGPPAKFLLPSLLSMPIPGSASSGTVDPSVLLAVLRSTAQQAQDLGPAEVGGVHVEHERAVVSWSAFGMVAKDMAQAVRYTGASGLTVDYWVDAAGLLRQLRTSITVHDVPGGSSSPVPPRLLPFTLTATLDLSDYGVAVSVAAPPASQISTRETCSSGGSSFTCE